MTESLTTPVRPLALELEDAKETIFGAINNMASQRNIPFFLLEGIVNEAARQVSDLAKKEREKAKQTYAIQLKEAMSEEKKEKSND